MLCDAGQHPVCWTCSASGVVCGCHKRKASQPIFDLKDNTRPSGGASEEPEVLAFSGDLFVTIKMLTKDTCDQWEDNND